MKRKRTIYFLIMAILMLVGVLLLVWRQVDNQRLEVLHYPPGIPYLLGSVFGPQLVCFSVGGIAAFFCRPRLSGKSAKLCFGLGVALLILYPVSFLLWWAGISGIFNFLTIWYGVFLLPGVLIGLWRRSALEAGQE
ncbi:MAG: hypothetical protein ACI3VN_11190 [Candidatus Onthomonas sp.]